MEMTRRARKIVTHGVRLDGAVVARPSMGAYAVPCRPAPRSRSLRLSPDDRTCYTWLRPNSDQVFR